MTDARTALKSLIIYGVCIPLALLLGYLLANPLDMQGLTLIGVVFLVLCAPLVIHFHYPFMLLAWNMGAVVFFLPGRMNLWTVAILMSFGMAFTHRILDKSVRFRWQPELARPLILLAVVVVVTAQLRGGFGLRSMGGDVVGGRRYIEILVGILGFFALTTCQIPRERVRRYLALFYLGGTATAISILYGRLPTSLNFIFLFIPPQTTLPEGAGVFIAFRPLAWAALAIYGYLLARYGIREIFSPRRKPLLFFFVLVVATSLLSGSRLAVVIMVMAFACQYWLEGLVRTRLTPVIGLGSILLLAVAMPFVQQLPISMQRALAVLPIKVDPVAEAAARDSSEWRREIWRVTTPQIPQYLLLGKGYGISRGDYGFMTDQAFAARTVEDRAATIAGDYHNGPLSVIMPLGIWGVLAFLWLLAAGFRALLRNYKYGDPELRNVNTYLLSSFVVATVVFIFVFGSLNSGMVGFAGILGMSVALNGGIARPPAPTPYVPAPKPGPQSTRPSRRLPATAPKT